MLASRNFPRRISVATLLISSIVGYGLSGECAAQAPEVGIGPAPAPTLSITTREVLIDVVAVDAGGRPAAGLTAANFKVTEDGAPQTIVHFNEHQPMPAAEAAQLAAPPLPPNTFTNYTPVANTNASTVLLLDAMDMGTGTNGVIIQARLREQVISYLKKMQPGPSMAIFQLDTAMHLIQGFTSDPKVLLAAMESKRDMPSMAHTVHGNAEMVQIDNQQVLRGGMQAMSRYLAGFPGRKNLIWFTEHVPDPQFYTGWGGSFKDTFNLVEDSAGNGLPELTGALTVSRVAVYPAVAGGVALTPGFDASARNAPRGGNYGFVTQQNLLHTDLDAAAQATGGKAYYNTNDMGQVIAQVVSEGTDYYTLAYATTNEKWNGQFQKIKITVDRPGVKLEYRPGYYAVDTESQTPAQTLAAAQPDAARQPAGATGALIRQTSGGFAAAMELGGIPPTEIVFSARVEPAAKTEKFDKKESLPPGNFLRPEWRGQTLRNYTVIFDANPHQVRLTRGPDGRRQGRLQFVSVVYDSTGAEVNALKSTAVLNLDEAGYEQVLQQGLVVKETVAVPVKGNFFLRLGVHDESGGGAGALEVAVDQVKMGAGGMD